MGAPFTHYDQLIDLARGDAAAKKLFGAYSLFAIVSFSPRGSPGFARHLEERFAELDGFSGPNLLFFAPVEPPREWLESRRVRARPYVQALKGQARPARAGPYPSLESPEGASFAARVLFGLPLRSVPYLVVTGDLSSSKSWWMETSEESLERQLIRLGALALDLADRKQRVNIAERLAAIANSEGRACGSAKRDHSVQHALEALTAGARSRHEVLPREGYRTQRPGEVTDYHNVERGLSGRRPSTLEPMEEKLLRQVERGALVMAAEAAIRDVEISGRLEIERGPDGEPEHFRLLEAEVRDLFRRGRAIIEANGQRGAPAEHMCFAGVICVAAAVERELNLSLGHLIRRALGVSLPEYYDLFQRGPPRPRAVLIPRGGERTDFNGKSDECLPDTHRHYWRAIPLGTLRVAAEHVWCSPECREMPLSDDVRSIDLREILGSWQDLSKVRNKAAHRAKVSFEQASAALHAGRTILESRVVAQLCAFKPALAGRR